MHSKQELLPDNEHKYKKFVSDCEDLPFSKEETAYLLLNKYFAEFTNNAYFINGKFNDVGSDDFVPFSSFIKANSLYPWVNQHPTLYKKIPDWYENGFYLTKQPKSVAIKKGRDGLNSIFEENTYKPVVRDLFRNTLIITSFNYLRPIELANYLCKYLDQNEAVSENYKNYAEFRVSEIKMKKQKNGYQDLTVYLEPTVKMIDKFFKFIKNDKLLKTTLKESKPGTLREMASNMCIELQLTTNSMFLTKVQETSNYDRQKCIEMVLSKYFNNVKDILDKTVKNQGISLEGKLSNNDIRKILRDIDDFNSSLKSDEIERKFNSINSLKKMARKTKIEIYITAIGKIYAEGVSYANKLYERSFGVFNNFNTNDMKVFIDELERLFPDLKKAGKIKHQIPGRQ